MIGLGLLWRLTEGCAEAFALFIVLVLLPGVALAMLLGERRFARWTLVIGKGRPLDRRQWPAPMPWAAMQEATVQGLVPSKGSRSVLTNGDRYDTDRDRLAADPLEVMRLVQDRASRAAG